MRFVSNLASVMVILGLAAIVAGFFNRVPNVLKWIDRWGEVTSWLIKIALVAGGGLIWFIARPRATNDDEKES